MALTDNDLQELAELFLEKRLSEHSSALERCQEEVEADIAERNLSSGAMARGLLVSAWAEAFERHCQQVLGDLIGLMRTFSAVSSAEGIREKLDAHLDAAAEQLVQGLSDSSFGGVGSVPSERKRVANMVSGVKRLARESWSQELERAAREGALAGSLESSAEDLDDRLPLNRRGAFDRDLPEMVAAAEGAEELLSLVMIDIDHFKAVNDQHGHPVGDEVLLEVAELVVRRASRKGKAYRYGGEEFALLLPTYSAEEAVGLAERIRKDISAEVLSSKSLRVTASFGVACLPDQADDARSLLELADAALYQAKHGGRNQVRSADSPS
jgi:diguanylate cyclase (GGDEF)-like protein